jgi:hypothetical protein
LLSDFPPSTYMSTGREDRAAPEAFDSGDLVDLYVDKTSGSRRVFFRESG